MASLEADFRETLYSSHGLLARGKISQSEFFTRIIGDGVPVMITVTGRRPGMSIAVELMVQRRSDGILRLGFPPIGEDDIRMSALVGLSDEGNLRVNEVIVTRPSSESVEGVPLNDEVVNYRGYRGVPVPREDIGSELLENLLNLSPDPYDAVGNELAKILKKDPHHADEPSMPAGEQIYTPRQLLREVRDRTEFGRRYANHFLDRADEQDVPLSFFFDRTVDPHEYFQTEEQVQEHDQKIPGESFNAMVDGMKERDEIINSTAQAIEDAAVQSMVDLIAFEREHSGSEASSGDNIHFQRGRLHGQRAVPEEIYKKIQPAGNLSDIVSARVKKIIEDQNP